jgi:hypothetical protein
MLRSCLVLFVFAIASGLAFAEDQPSADCATSAPLVDCAAVVQSQSCDVPRDERECNRCIVDFLGSCRVRANDPSCESAKAAQNGMYSIKKAQCEADKTARKVQCEATNSALKLAAAACKAKAE